MLEVTHGDRVVFPEIGRTKGDVVAYYQRLAGRILPHLEGRPLSIRRYPKGVAAPGFFQKNVPPHYPDTIRRFAVPRSAGASKKHPAKKDGAKPDDVTLYPLVDAPEHVAYLANQGAIELHVTTARAVDAWRPDRLVIDLDPPAGAVALVRRAAFIVRDALKELGLSSAAVATGSKGFHVVAPIAPPVDGQAIAATTQKLATMLAAKHADALTTAFRVAERGHRVFVDWLRNRPGSTVVVPYSLRARPNAACAVPLEWDEVDAFAPDAFTIADVDALLARPDPLVDLASGPGDPASFVAAVDAAFAASGLTLEHFDRFRS